MRETAEMAARASPRKPRVPMASRSYSVRSLLVAWRRKAVSASAAAMPQPYEAHAAVLDLHGQGVRPGVDGVLHELLDHRRGPLHHLAGGDQIGHVGI
jgi:hypothetical protein